MKLAGVSFSVFEMNNKLSLAVGLLVKRLWIDMEIFTELCQKCQMVRVKCGYTYVKGARSRNFRQFQH